MYKYNTYTDKLKFSFNGLDKVLENYSQSLQDLFVLSVLDGKINGTYLEVGAHHPTFLSNTCLLEKIFNWSGVSIDIDENIRNTFNSIRKNHILIQDALTIDYKYLLQDHNRVDYLSLDIEPNYNTLQCLKLILKSNVRFSVITYETDVYDPNQSKNVNEQIQKESRQLLNDAGYTLVAGNISNLDDLHPFEDWYVDSNINAQKFIRDSDLPIAAHRYMLV